MRNSLIKSKNQRLLRSSASYLALRTNSPAKDRFRGESRSYLSFRRSLASNKVRGLATEKSSTLSGRFLPASRVEMTG
jgi:hypothetical protein